MQLDAIETLVKAIPGFGGRVSGVLELARLQRQNQLPQTTPAAFVSPAGLVGGAADVISGLYRQSYRETVAVTIVMRSSDDPRSNRSRDPLNALRWEVIHALAGIEMGGTGGQLRFDRDFLVSTADGAAIYQLEFSVGDQLRIAR